MSYFLAFCVCIQGFWDLWNGSTKIWEALKTLNGSFWIIVFFYTKKHVNPEIEKTSQNWLFLSGFDFFILWGYRFCIVIKRTENVISSDLPFILRHVRLKTVLYKPLYGSKDEIPSIVKLKKNECGETRGPWGYTVHCTLRVSVHLRDFNWHLIYRFINQNIYEILDQTKV